MCVCCVVWVGQSKELGLEVKHQPPKQESTRPQWLCECTRLSGRCNLKGNCVPFSHAQICDVIFIVLDVEGVYGAYHCESIGVVFISHWRPSADNDRCHCPHIGLFLCLCIFVFEIHQRLRRLGSVGDFECFRDGFDGESCCCFLIFDCIFRFFMFFQLIFHFFHILMS